MVRHSLGCFFAAREPQWLPCALNQTQVLNGGLGPRMDFIRGRARVATVSDAARPPSPECAWNVGMKRTFCLSAVLVLSLITGCGDQYVQEFKEIGPREPLTIAEWNQLPPSEKFDPV